MSKVYFPLRYLDVPASPPHGSDPAYRVSFGVEHWGDGEPQHVYKIQMAYAGRVAGRKTPSFPEGTDDLERVYAAMARLKKGEGQRSRGTMTVVGDEPGMPIAEAHNLLEALE